MLVTEKHSEEGIQKKSNLCKFTQTDVTLTGRFPCPHAWCCQTVLVLSAVVQTERKAAAECGGFKSKMTVNITNSTKWCQLNFLRLENKHDWKMSRLAIKSDSVPATLKSSVFRLKHDSTGSLSLPHVCRNVKCQHVLMTSSFKYNLTIIWSFKAHCMHL